MTGPDPGVDLAAESNGVAGTVSRRARSGLNFGLAKRHARGAGNLVALTVIQGSNALLPLVAFPYLLSVLGSDGYSRVAVTESIALLVQTLVIYSFDIEGITRVGRLHPARDREELSRIFSTILFARLGIVAAASVIVVSVAAITRPVLVPMLLAWMLLPLGYALQSAWYFQAVERNVVPASVVLLARVACVGALYLTVTAAADFRVAPVIIGASYGMAGLIILVQELVRGGVRLTRVRWTDLRDYFKDGRHIFAGNLSVTMYRDSNVLILGAVSTSGAVALYSVAEKLIKVAQAVARPLSQHMYPRLVRALADEQQPTSATRRTVMRYTYPQVGIVALGVVLAGVVFLTSRPYLPAAFRAPEAERIAALAAIMSVSVVFGVMNFMLGTGGLNALGRRRYFAAAIFATGVASLAVATLLSYRFGAPGAATAFAGAEILLFTIVQRAYRAAPSV